MFSELLSGEENNDEKRENCFMEKAIRSTRKVIPDRVEEKLITNISTLVSQGEGETTVIVNDD